VANTSVQNNGSLQFSKAARTVNMASLPSWRENRPMRSIHRVSSHLWRSHAKVLWSWQVHFVNSRQHCIISEYFEIAMLLSQLQSACYACTTIGYRLACTISDNATPLNHRESQPVSAIVEVKAAKLLSLRVRLLSVSLTVGSLTRRFFPEASALNSEYSVSSL
jgi:hypothetical protein